MLFNAALLLIFVQSILLMADLVFNVIVGIFLTAPQVQVAIFIVQDLCLLLAAGMSCLQMFSSWFCLSGFLRPIFLRFWSTALGWVIYFGLTLGIHVWAITQWYQNDTLYRATTAFRVLYTVQRVFSYVYYFLIFRKALESTKMSDLRRRNSRGMGKERNTQEIQQAGKDNPVLAYATFTDNLSPATAPRLRI